LSLWRRSSIIYSRAIEPKETDMLDTALTIRTAEATDGFAVRRLAVLDSSDPPTCDVLLAEVGDELWAALSLDTGAAVADPFRPSGDLVELLRFQADRIRAGEHAERTLARLRPRAA
jgi:hypothetical protein